MPDGRVLVVGARARFMHGSADRNGVIYDSGGNVELEATIGDGVEHLQTTTDGSVWVGYFDEGVYGNFGWGLPAGPTPVGSSGIVRFSSALEVDWEYTGGTVDDCYALNVADDAVWACYYSDFPVVRITPPHVRAWSNSVGGATALVVADGAIVLVGGYRGEADRVTILETAEQHCTPVARGRFRIHGRDASPRIFGRGDRLHAFVGPEWYVADAEQLTDSITA